MLLVEVDNLLRGHHGVTKHPGAGHSPGHPLLVKSSGLGFDDM